MWHVLFRVGYRFLRLIDPLVRLAWRAHVPGLGRAVDLQTVGRHSGRPRHVMLTQLTLGDHRYVGHPNGAAAWMRNLEAEPTFSIRDRDGLPERGRAVAVSGLEREQVIQATWSQQPFPANIVYWLARDHIRAAGVYVRLETDRY